MSTDYFHRLHTETPTRFWINNPSREDTERAIAAGAINCTTNPAFCSKLLASDPQHIRSIIDEVVRRVDDDDAAAEAAYHQAAQWIMHRFVPLYESSGGKQGFVTIQGDPRAEEDAHKIVAEAMRGHALGPNFMAKIPVTVSGCQAIEELVARGTAVCATEVFAISQAMHVCDLYERVTRKSGKRPPFYVTHITGILEEYWRGLVKSEHIPIAPDVLTQAGCAAARRQYRVLKERGYTATMLGGGARNTSHFTEFVGSDMHITINWSTAVEIMAADTPIEPRIDTVTADVVVQELMAKLPSFRRAYAEDGLRPEQFRDFGGVVHFRNQFMAGYSRLLEEVAARRALLGSGQG